MLWDNENNEYSGLGNSLFYGGPIFILNNDVTNNLLHDQYNVFVNNDYIGKKVLLTDTEKPSDLEKYLYSQGFTNFKTDINQTDIKIKCNEDTDKIESILGSYLRNK